MSSEPTRRDIVAIGASARSLPHIRTILELLPADLRAAVLVALHRPGDQVSRLRDILALKSRMPVVEATDGQELVVGACYLGLPAEHLGIDELARAEWRYSIAEARDDVEDHLTPSMRPELEAELPKLFGRGRRAAALGLSRHGEVQAAQALPAACPYDLGQILGPDWYPANRHGLRDEI